MMLSNAFQNIKEIETPQYLISENENVLATINYIKEIVETKLNKNFFPNQILQFSIIMHSYYQKKNSKNKKIFEIKIIPAIWNNKLNFIFIIRDRSYLDIISDLQKNDEKKTTILASVTHELRTPLNNIIAMLETLKGEIIKELNKKFVDPALTSSKILLNLINDILDISQIKEGKLRLIFSEFNLKKLLLDCLNLFAIQAKNRGISLIFDYDAMLCKHCISEPNRIRQIIINLIGNSMKFTQKGSITLKAEYDEDYNIKISVIDTGLGISEMNQNKLFTAFGKLDEGENNIFNETGVGLGLMISHSLAQRLGPSDNSGINVFSELGKGATFYFFIENKLISSPKLYKKINEEELSSSNDENNQKSEEEIVFANNIITLNNKFKNYNNIMHPKFLIKNEKKEVKFIDMTFDKMNNKRNESDIKNSDIELKKLEKKKIPNSNTLSIDNFKINSIREQFLKNCNDPDILVVDDSDFNLMAMKMLLNNYGLKCEFAFNGEDAIKMILQKYKENNCCPKYKLIFMDFEMPVKSGIEAAKEIDELIQKNEIEKTPIIATTANTLNHEKIKKKYFMDDFIEKPITQKNLLNILEKWALKKDTKVFNIKLRNTANI